MQQEPGMEGLAAGRPSLSKRYRDESPPTESNIASWSEVSSESSLEVVSASLSSISDDESKKSSPVNLLVEIHALTETIEKNCHSPQCHNPVVVEYKTITLASFIMICCKDEECDFQYNCPAPAAANVDDKDNDFKRTTDNAVNVLYVLGFLSSGDGGVEAARLLGLLGLPNDVSMETRTLPKIEARIAPKLLLENLTEEARLSFTDVNDLISGKKL
jgi:hypothetical protein